MFLKVSKLSDNELAEKYTILHEFRLFNVAMFIFTIMCGLLISYLFSDNSEWYKWFIIGLAIWNIIDRGIDITNYLNVKQELKNRKLAIYAQYDIFKFKDSDEIDKN